MSAQSAATSAIRATERMPVKRSRWRISSTMVLSIVLLPIMLLGWEYWVQSGAVSKTLVAPPSAVAVSLYRAVILGGMWSDMWVTAQEVILGFLVGGGVGILIGSILGESVVLDRILRPYVIAFQSIPKIALAPLIVIWLGFDLASKVAIASTISFFPVLINTLAGIRAAPHEQVELMQAYGGTRLQTFLRVKLPNALPYIFAGLNIAATLSVIGAIVGEFLGSDRGLGYVVLSAGMNLNMSSVFAAIVIIAVMATILSTTIQILERRIVFWRRQGPTGSDS